MSKRNITYEVYEKVIEKLPKRIIEMLPESPEKLLPYAKRITEIKFSNGISEDVKKLMKEKLLSDEEYLKTFFYVFAITFYHKNPVNNPEIAIVSAQTGSGKSNLTAKLLRKNENFIFVDSDKYKHFRFDAQEIAKNYQMLYPFLTGPDGYDHADNIYEYAINHNYNVIKETAPSKNKGLLGVDKEELLNKGYKISLHILTVGKLNSLLSTHERYELQIIYGLKTAKLTPTSRHNESYDALIPAIEALLDDKNIEINVYKRGMIEENFDPIKIASNKKDTKEIIVSVEKAREEDNIKTIAEFNKRYNLIITQMNKRKAPKEQFEQLENVRKEFESYGR